MCYTMPIQTKHVWIFLTMNHETSPASIAPETSSFAKRASRAFAVGGGKELAEQFSAASAVPEGIWKTDAAIRGYAIDGWKGMTEAIAANAIVGGGALALDQLEKRIVGDMLLHEAKEFIEARHPRPSDIPQKARWESPWISVVDNVEETGSDMVINFAAKKAVNAVMKPDTEVSYASPMAEVIADGVNLATFIFGKTTPVQRLGLTYAKIRNSVNATDTESVMRAINVLPVVGAFIEKNIYSPINHALEHNTFVKAMTGWTMKSSVWYIIGMLANDAGAKTAENFTKKK